MCRAWSLVPALVSLPVADAVLAPVAVVSAAAWPAASAGSSTRVHFLPGSACTLLMRTYWRPFPRLTSSGSLALSPVAVPCRYRPLAATVSAVCGWVWRGLQDVPARPRLERLDVSNVCSSSPGAGTLWRLRAARDRHRGGALASV